MPEQFYAKELANGMTMLGQQMDYVSSAAATLVVPSGAAYDPPEAAGAASVTCEWCVRGAGDRTTRQLNDALDALGCQHHESVRSEHLLLTAAQLGRNLLAVLGIFADILRRPRLEDETFAPSRALIEQDLASLEDEPARKCSLLLREKFYPSPLGRCVYGTPETLAALEPAMVRDHIREHVGPTGAILAVAGNIDWPSLCDRVEELFGDWPATEVRAHDLSDPAAGVTHIPKDSAQAHIALAHQAVPTHHRQYYAARVAEMVLSGGASARLHTEVREKRGLAYHVASHYHSLKDHAGMFAYAGTRPEIARQTFEQVVTEIRRLGDGISGEEVTRARTQLKSALIMQGESTSARANALASDWYHLGRVRGLAELSQAIQSVTADDVLEYLRDCPPREFTVLVIGPEPLDTSILDC
ncbi:MAG: pitrilysin family protein [Phycisphaerae bacterium]